MKGLCVLPAVVAVVLMVHAWGVFAAGVSPLVSCDPDCTGTTSGDKVVDPMNCTAFYYCNNGVPYGPVPCETGTIFDATEGNCVPGTSCENICSPGGGDCPLTCNGTVTVIGDAFSCSTYYYCTPSGPSAPNLCPSDRPHFDGLECVNDESVCCGGYCTADCDGTGFALVPDPNDCTMFFICDTEAGPPDEEHHFTCQGGYFSVQLGDCVSGTPPNPCPTLCDAAGGGGGSSSTTASSGGGGGSTTSGNGGSTTSGSGGSTSSGGSSTTSGSGGSTSSGGSSTTSGSGGSTTAGGGGSTDSNGCVSSLVCSEEGFFAACATCQPQYFDCAGAGSAGVLDTCPDDTVFNPTPGYPFCVLPSNCPYP